ncbi:UTRA domain-containing protein [Meridianimarinicoccus sp. MJW13]|uniref:UTRA domain-containing protein n=1 Tax=Meridianimarinicoccus sp. MJW13 TaxID=2720031 RepID=UPI0018680BA9|nr:UTRA domain-containing protein [Fluviibacterium sp. MJW13]
MTAEPKPLYSQIKSAIEDRIESRDWHADFKVPSEEALSEEFNVSHLTVRRALRELQSEGVLVRVRGRGTFVVGPRMQCAVFGIEDVSEEIENNGGVHSSEIVTLCALEPDDPRYNLLPVNGGTVYYSRILHMEDRTPIQIEDRFINAALAPDYISQDFTRITTHAYLLRETKVSFVDNTIRAIRPDEEAQQLLQIDAAHPCLLINRQTWHDDTPVTRSRFLYPGDRYRLSSAHEATNNASVMTPPSRRSNPSRR